MARIKTGVPVVKEIKEGETERRYIPGTGMITYTRYNNQLYSSKSYPSSIPPTIDKKTRSTISSTSFITQNIASGELDLDFSSLVGGPIADGDSILFIDATASSAVKKEALADVATLFAGAGLTASSSVIAVDADQSSQITTLSTTSFSDGNLTNVGDINADSLSVDDATVGLDIQFGGATTKNKITLTDNLADALNITESTNSYIKFITTDSSEQIVFGKNSTFNGTTIADLGTVSAATSITATDLIGTNVDGILGADTARAITGTTIDATTDFTIDGLVLTADTITNDADLEIVSTGLTLNASLDIALSADGGNVTMDDGTTTVFDFNTDDPELKIMDDAQVANYASIAVGANGATTFTTVDTDAAAANLLFTVDGTAEIASQGLITLDSGAAINLEPASGSAIILDGTINFDAGVISTIVSAHDTAGTSVSFSAGNTTAGTTDNIAGGSLTFQGGQGKGSGAGGDIIFKTANAGGSGSSINALATALTISDDLSAAFGGAVDINSGTIDGTTVGANSATSGAFTTITASTSVDITGSAGLILENDETITNSSNGYIALSGHLTIPDAGNIGSASDTDAISISSGGAVTFSQRDIHSAGITIADAGNIGSASDLDAMSISSAGLVNISQTATIGTSTAAGEMSDLLSSAQKTFFADLLDDNDDVFDFGGNNGDGGTTAIDSDGFVASNATFIHDSGSGLITNTASAQGYVSLAITTVVNKIYEVNFDVIAGADSDVEVCLSSSTSWNTAAESGARSAGTTHSLVHNYVADDTSTYLIIRLISSSSSDEGRIDNILVREAAKFSGAEIGSASFVSGFAGAGWKIDKDATADNEFDFTVDNMSIRGRLSVYELLIQQIRATNGSVFISSAAKVDSTSGLSATDAVGDITFEDPSGHGICPFAVNDLIMMQRVVPGSLVAGNSTAGSTDVIKKLVYKVTAISGATATVTGLPGGTDIGFTNNTFPSKGDDFVRIGNTGTSARQGIIYLTSDDSNAPYIDIKSGVSSYALWHATSTTKVRLGNLAGITDSAMNGGSELSGYGLYATGNVHIKGALVAGSLANAGTTATTNQGFYADSDGNLLLKGDDNDTNYIKFDVDAGNGALQIKTGNFSVDSSGDCTMAGTVTASAGEIGGWTIGSDYIKNSATNGAIWAGVSNADSGQSEIRISSDGAGTGTSNYVRMYIDHDVDTWGIEGVSNASGSAQTVFHLGETTGTDDNQIAGWSFTNNTLYKTDTTTIGITTAGHADSPAGANPQFFAGASGGNASLGGDAQIAFANNGKIYGNGVYVKNDIDYLITASRLFGNGSDGDVTLSSTGTLTLSRDMYYNDFTMQGNCTITANGYRIFVRGTFTIGGAGCLIKNNGSAGDNGSNGESDLDGGAGGSGSGAGGAEGSLRGGVAGGNGGAGGQGSDGAQPVTAGGVGSATSQTNVVKAYTGPAGARGADGGASGGSSSAASAASGTEGKISMVNSDLTFIIAMRDIFAVGDSAPSLYPATGSAGGGGGGGGGYTAATSGDGGGGGGQGGGSGGHVMLCAKFISGTQSNLELEAKGGAGGNGGRDGSVGLADGGKGAGGNGGDGGCVTVISGTDPDGITIDVAGGSAGSNGSAGGSANIGTPQTGATGTSIVIHC